MAKKRVILSLYIAPFDSHDSSFIHDYHPCHRSANLTDHNHYYSPPPSFPPINTTAINSRHCYPLPPLLPTTATAIHYHECHPLHCHPPPPCASRTAVAPSPVAKSGHHSALLRGLQPETWYVIQLGGYTMKGDGSRSRSQTEKTLPAGRSAITDGYPRVSIKQNKTKYER